MDEILIIDFGSRYTNDLVNRIKDLGVCNKVLPFDTVFSDALPGGPGAADSNGNTVKGIIFTGSPKTIYKDDAPAPDKKFYACGLPILGICYGHQRLNWDSGGVVAAMPETEKGKVEVKGRFPKPDDPLFDPEKAGRFFAAFDERFSLDYLKSEDFKKMAAPSFPSEWASAFWMNHDDTVTVLAPGFTQYAVSPCGSPSVIVHESQPWIGVQFHPEANDYSRADVLAAFVFGVCGVEGNI